mmetsp:Transcript_38578/g.115800  ORF Transcript_38578/g.115800 Transcript_38578/m.115800 type:complete len:218 (-) Transcript_38578:796-1449(-)
MRIASIFHPPKFSCISSLRTYYHGLHPPLLLISPSCSLSPPLSLYFYIIISPRYSLAPSPLPDCALGLAHLTLDLALMAAMTAPGLSVGSAAFLYSASDTHTALKPKSRETHASSTSSSALLSLAKILLMAHTSAPSGTARDETHSYFSAGFPPPSTLRTVAPPSTAACASSAEFTSATTSNPSARAASTNVPKRSAPATPTSIATASAPNALDRAI